MQTIARTKLVYCTIYTSPSHTYAYIIQFRYKYLLYIIYRSYVSSVDIMFTLVIPIRRLYYFPTLSAHMIIIINTK